MAATWLRGRARRARADDAAGHGRRGRRRQDRHQHRRGQEPGRGLPRARGRAVRPGGAGDAAARRAGQRHGRGGQVRLHRRPGDPRRRRAVARGVADPRLAGAARAGRAGDPGQDRRGVRRPPRDRARGRGTPGPGGAQLRTHAGARHRAGRGLPDAPRRGGRAGHGLRRRAGPAQRPARRRDGRAAPVDAGARRAADVVRRGVVGGPARHDADRQEDPRRPAALRGARGAGSPGRPGGADRGGAAGGVRGRLGERSRFPFFRD